MRFTLMSVSSMLILLISLCSLCACETSRAMLNEQTTAKESLLADDIATADTRIDSKEVAERYSDKLLYLMDAGWINFYNDDYDTALRHFDNAEAIAEERRIASFSNTLGTIAINDNASDYVAENYEDAYLNIAKALIYQKQGNIEDAFVEIRRVDQKLADYSYNIKKQGNDFQNFLLSITGNPFVWTDNDGGFGRLTIPAAEDYVCSPVASYLSMLFYRAEGDEGNAVVDFNRLNSMQVSVCEDDLYVPSGKARMNFIILEGLLPEKEEESVIAYTTLPGGTGIGIDGRMHSYPSMNYYHKAAWPVLSNTDPSQIVATIVRCSNGDTVKPIMLEDMRSVAKRAIAMDTTSKYLASYYRGYLKGCGTYMAVAPISYSIRGGLGSIAIYIALEAVKSIESADLRMASFIPKSIKSCGFTLEPGTYDFSVEYILKNGLTIVKEYKDVEVRADGLNMIVSECTR